MNKIYNYTLSKESFEEILKAKRFNRCLKITYRDRTGRYTHALSAGTDNVIYVYRDGLETFILSRNPRLEYVGLEIFESADKMGDIFLQGHQLKEVLGKRDLAAVTIIKRLRSIFFNN